MKLTKKIKHSAYLVVLFSLLLSGSATASLTLLQPDIAVPATFVGTGGVSTDGLGQTGSLNGTIQAEIPAGSTVVQAYLYGTHTSPDPTIVERTINFDGTEVITTKLSSIIGYLSTSRVDVSAQVASKVGAGGGITNFTIFNDPPRLDGVALVVIYSNPALPTTTIAVLDGSGEVIGDTATFNFAAPLDKTTSGFFASLALGSGFSYQGNFVGHACGGGQTSVVLINGNLLSNCAGHNDDGDAGGSGLITVGGVGDSMNNPINPNNPIEDDELYDLEPLLAQGDTAIQIASSNPSQDDNLFLAVIAITAEAAVTTEICNDGIDNDGDGLIDSEDPDCVAPPQPEICDDGIDNDGDELIDSDDPDCVADTRRFTGGGIIRDNGLKVNHGFTLHCDAVNTPGTPARLQVNWGKGNKFHLEELTNAVCDDNPDLDEANPDAGFDTYTGAGVGRHNGVSGVTAEWIITDNGEPGKADRFQIIIMDGDDELLNVDGNIQRGNHQAHP